MEDINASELPSLTELASGTPLAAYGNYYATLAALAEAQAEFEPVHKDREGQIGNVMLRYADLAQLRKATTKALSKHGISCPQFLVDAQTEGKRCVVTMLYGKGGMVVARYTYDEAEDIRQDGKVSTYARRYGYQAVLGLDGDQDEDTQAAPTATKKGPRVPKWDSFEPDKGKLVSEASVDTLRAIARELDQPRHIDNPEWGEKNREVLEAAKARLAEIGKPRSGPAKNGALVPPVAEGMCSGEHLKRIKDARKKKGIEGGPLALAVKVLFEKSSPMELTADAADYLVDILTGMTLEEAAAVQAGSPEERRQAIEAVENRLGAGAAQ